MEETTSSGAETNESKVFDNVVDHDVRRRVEPAGTLSDHDVIAESSATSSDVDAARTTDVSSSSEWHEVGFDYAGHYHCRSIRKMK